MTDQWNSKESKNTPIHLWFIFNKTAKAIQRGQVTVFSINGARAIGYHMPPQENLLDPYLTLHYTQKVLLYES